MEITYSSSISLLCCIVLFIAVWEFLNRAWFTPKKKEKKFKDQGISGQPYRISLQGFTNILEMETSSKPMNLYDDDITSRIIFIDPKSFDGREKCGYAWLGTTPQLMVFDPELIKEITLRNYHFVKVRQNPLGQLLMKGISSLNGEEWSKHRKIIAPAFHTDKLKLMLPAIQTCISEVLTKWEEIVSSKGSAEIDVWPCLRRLTGDVISRTAFGSNYEDGKEIFELQKEQAQYFIEVALSPYIPGWRFFPTKRNRRMKEINRTVNDKVRHIVEARMKAMKAGEAAGDDFLGLLLESNSKEIDERGSKDFGLSIQDVIDECKLLYVAGQETTSVLIVWTMILLGRHPEWQNRAREEVLQLFGKHQIPDYSGLNQLKIMTMLLYEVMRLYPPASGIQRITDEETKLGDFTIPKGTHFVLPAILLHHHPMLWGDDADQFKPERFAEGISNANKGKFSYLPFGWGPRICLGQNFAMMETKMAISMILQRFSFEIAPSYSHHPYQSPLTVQPKHGAHLIVHKL